MHLKTHTSKTIRTGTTLLASAAIACFASIHNARAVAADGDLVVISGATGSSVIITGSSSAFFKSITNGAVSGTTGKVIFNGSLITQSGSAAVVTSANSSGIFLRSGSTTSIIALKGDVAAVSGSNVLTFAKFGPPLENNDGDASFLGVVAGPGVTTANDQGVFYISGTTVNLIAREGDAAPGSGGASFLRFKEIALPETAFGPVLLVTLTGSGVTSANSAAVYTTGSNGSLSGSPALRLSSTVALTSGTTIVNKQLKKMQFLSGLSHVHGQTRNFDENGNLLITAKFSDGSTGIISVPIP